MSHLFWILLWYFIGIFYVYAKLRCWKVTVKGSHGNNSWQRESDSFGVKRTVSWQGSAVQSAPPGPKQDKNTWRLHTQKSDKSNYTRSNTDNNVTLRLFNWEGNYGLEKGRKDAAERHQVANYSQDHGECKKVRGSWDEGHRLTAFQSERAMTEIKVSYIEIVLVKWEGKRKIWVRQTERKTFHNQQRNLEKPASFGPRVRHHQQLSYRQALLPRLSFWTRRSLREKKSDLNTFVKVALKFSSARSERVGQCSAAA